MSTKKQASLMISLPKETKLALRKIAAEKNMDNPDRVTSAAAIARMIILDHMEKIESLKTE
ncbi:hypothetical protein SAMN02745216_02978 [Desulfatibacillum alkenivorans DSM 16219]|jgi:hypothetical protein|uniref:Uncharacterized protein n=1 Tax=Desulfatibacillum alkenivorans DSM 16219 TaxID=1121393 RepID=A0A1M6Q6M9_9BACT|nr:hypothetical protein [Desulfatibacillum alkenivorans]SHK15892.1 hypothetical protein SAMN02745216_02978 [Desulfatibacillum alkenivorans DSM 16219]